MGKFEFKPQKGLTTKNSYLHGIGELKHYNHDGVIEHVGEDYFVLRVEDCGPLFVEIGSYWCVEEGDFE